jgi:hypothetical protein
MDLTTQLKRVNVKKALDLLFVPTSYMRSGKDINDPNHRYEYAGLAALMEVARLSFYVMAVYDLLGGKVSM